MTVVAVHRDAEHRFSKQPVEEIVLLAGLGVKGDAHLGVTVQHRSRVRRDPTQPNLRQVHLIHAELLDEVSHEVRPGDLGENVTTRGVDLLGLPTGTLLHLGAEAVVRVTGLRNPCTQIDGFSDGLLRELVTRDEAGHVVRLGGVMGVVERGGVVRAGDAIVVETPAGEPRPLEPV
ncbi:MOSC domain-containing protein [Nocardioides mangrovicus]|uniref:MOSC domain-containing protein n=1 Tax=Nocardioides mangrovicus TaxID=2478913 RepID=UPI001E317DA1|nr:MOSC domain-containing protein [Nocardioides mangrovicus]